MAFWEEERTLASGNAEKGKIAVRADLGISVEVKHWGVKKPQDANVAGFPNLFQDNWAMPMAERRAESLTVAVQTIDQVLGLQRWKPEQVEGLYLACTNPLDFKILQNIVDGAGLSHLSWPGQVWETRLACNSGARAMQLAFLTGREARKKLIVTMDHMTGPTTDEESADPLSWKIFSNGLSVTALDLDKGLTYEAGSKLHLLPDKGGALAVSLAAIEKTRKRHNVGEVVMKRGMEYIVMPQPKDQRKVIEMNGFDTAKLFADLLARHAPQFFTELAMKGINADHWVVHQPSIGMLTLVQRKLNKLGFEPSLKWMGVDGNSSGTTIMEAMAMQLEEVQPDQKMGLMGFGAGTSMTSLVVGFKGK